MSTTRRIDLVMAVAAVVTVVVTVPSLAQDAQTVLVDLPSAGRLAAVGAELTSVLESEGMHVLQPVAGQWPEPLPSRVVTDADSIRDEQRQQALRQFIDEGGGLVLIISRSRRSIEQANVFVRPLGLEIMPVASSLEPVEFYDTPLASGLNMPDVGSLRLAITGQITVPIARQGDNLVCAATSYGRGGVILLPALLVLADGVPGTGLVCPGGAGGWRGWGWD